MRAVGSNDVRRVVWPGFSNGQSETKPGYYSFIAPSVVQQLLGYVCSLLSNVIKLKLFSALLLLASGPGC